MKSKNKNSQIKTQQHRSTEARIGAVVLALTTAFAMAHSGRQAAHVIKAADVQPAFANVSAAENEIVRMPVRFSDGIRLPIVTGA